MKGRRSWKKMKPSKMETWGTWLWFKKKFIVPTKSVLGKLTSTSRRKLKGNGHGLVSLYKDMESCGEYADIRVMWEIIHSCPQRTPKRSERRSHRSSYWRFCFQPT
ncbi:hypothetical protein L484_000332 [Morus notabilis]|uniref:Uncharacterized protein n=1 Tax=Morus notabilis TaxID=981085 RepID=W9QSM7_9ROSA|nr:hypothetical protein L484_007919 [Morus notabilis]EXC43426.1 hypothetical protein L484_000332 [Morus notabilis]